jgi:hypothetical protein
VEWSEAYTAVACISHIDPENLIITAADGGFLQVGDVTVKRCALGDNDGFFSIGLTDFEYAACRQSLTTIAANDGIICN